MNELVYQNIKFKHGVVIDKNKHHKRKENLLKKANELINACNSFKKSFAPLLEKHDDRYRKFMKKYNEYFNTWTNMIWTNVNRLDRKSRTEIV